MANTFRNDNYQANGVFTVITTILLAILAVCGLLYVISSLFIIAAPDKVLTVSSGEHYHYGFLIIGLIGAVEIIVRILTIVFFLIWEYRAFNNLSALKARNLEFSPGWAVGWWFIPFANLVKPFQVMRELYNESDPDFDEEATFLHISSGTVQIIGFWWGAFLLSGFIERIVNNLTDSSGTASDYFAPFMIAAGITMSAAAVLAIIIVRNINRRQDERAAKVFSVQQFAVPPPTFERRTFDEND